MQRTDDHSLEGKDDNEPQVRSAARRASFTARSSIQASVKRRRRAAAAAWRRRFWDGGAV